MLQLALEVEPQPLGIEPYLPLIGIIVSAIIVGTFAVYNRQRGNLETKAPTVSEAWAETDKARAAKRSIEDWGYTLYRMIRKWVDAGRIELTRTEELKIRPPKAPDPE